MRRIGFCSLILYVGMCIPAYASQREHVNFDENWKFAFGDASDPAKDFGSGTEYFNYLTKAASIHNEGPYSPKFNPEKWGKEWKSVNLPHDWVVDLPFSIDASHSHGYKTVGYKYPTTSVGWYTKNFFIPEDDLGKRISLQFDGIFRDAKVWVNGFYLGNEPSGYAGQNYDISEYLNYGGDNLVAVRADATLEEGWFYEGGGIYRHVWLDKMNSVHVADNGTFVHASLTEPYDVADVTIETTVGNYNPYETSYSLAHTIYDGEGRMVAQASVPESRMKGKSESRSVALAKVEKPDLWSPETPHLYKVRTDVVVDGDTVDSYWTTTGFRDAVFDADRGFLLNGKPYKLKGVNMHQDHPGVGAGIPDAVQAYRLERLKSFGANAYRSSHNPMTPEMLAACDSIGMLVVEENRLTGLNDEHIRLLTKMIERDRNHPSVILWSVGNEEWGIEWNEKGTRIAESMREYSHRADSTRLMCVATSGGPSIVIPADVAGYNYILQNPVEQHRADYPQRKAIGSEETTGCGARGIYYNDHKNGYMVAINRGKSGPDSLYNAIERGWKFYDERPWLGGLFYWTGFDYRGESNPMVFPATGSQFGILDYCGFPKDEAYYLKSWWTDEPVLHIFPHWNLRGHEGEKVDIWAYSNCDEVRLIVNGKDLGKKRMPKNGHLSWDAVYQPGSVKAIGYKNGKKIMETVVETTGAPSKIRIEPVRDTIKADNRDVAVCNVSVEDNKGRFVPDSNVELQIEVEGPVRILGVGNGDPAYQESERPVDPESKTYKVKTFNGLAQILLQSTGEPGKGKLILKGGGIAPASVEINAVTPPSH